MDLRTFKKSFKFVCMECGTFSYLRREHCEHCGAQTLKKATKADYIEYANTNKIETIPRLPVGSKIAIGLAICGLIFIILGLTLFVLDSQMFPTGITLTIVGAIFLAVAIASSLRGDPGWDCCCLCLNS